MNGNIKIQVYEINIIKRHLTMVTFSFRLIEIRFKAHGALSIITWHLIITLTLETLYLVSADLLVILSFIIFITDRAELITDLIPDECFVISLPRSASFNSNNFLHQLFTFFYIKAALSYLSSFVLGKQSGLTYDLVWFDSEIKVPASSAFPAVMTFLHENSLASQICQCWTLIS